MRLPSFVRSFTDVRTYLHGFRLAHFYSYSHVREVRKMRVGAGASFAPNVSFRNGERIVIGAGSHIGEHSVVWAGNSSGSITFGEKCLLAPRCVLTASNYAIEQGTPVMDQPKIEKDIVLGRDVWLGAGVVVTAGVTIGDGAVVGAGAVVTKDLPAQCIAVGIPAKVVGYRPAAGTSAAVTTEVTSGAGT
ncbi:acyltransferase [Nakamurella sp. YIM 132087]|uniref:Acyltransferase n=1 Tax=Nakamurella alba TaxID=2665158 RepID=A0A7K1FSL3_9ACTN|nr:acyltransferase [Nakamurella alba]MTD15834.1 acyltransferase [Nakamurella alba]